MSMTRQRRGASLARLGGVTPTTGTDGGYPWSDGEYLYAADLNAAFSSLFSPGYLPLTGGTLTGPLQLAANPTLGTGAATKSYVDTVAAGVTGAATALNNIGRNLLHNPLFNVAQRGAGPFIANGYTLDRWAMFTANGTSSITWVGVGDASRAQIGDEAAENALGNVFVGSATAGSYNLIAHSIEDVRRLSGKTVTVSFWAQATAGTPKLGVSLNQNFGTGGSPSATVAGAGNAVTLSTTWARYQVTFSLPSVAGKTIGNNNNHCTILNLWYSAEATYAVGSGNIGVQSGTVYLWGVQLEIGSVATPLEKPDPQYDVANCQRFYQAGNSTCTAYQTGTITFNFTQSFPVHMRAPPTMAVVGTPSYVNASAWTAAGIGYDTFVSQGTATTTGTVNFAVSFTASADL